MGTDSQALALSGGPISKYKASSMHSDRNILDIPSQSATMAVIASLKEAGQDYEFYPTTEQQIQTIAADITSILETYDVTNIHSRSVKLLDVGCGDGRVLMALNQMLSADEENPISTEMYAIEKASVHTDTYRAKDITLLGTEFHETNFISKSTDIAFVNSPYSEFSVWMETLLYQLNFKLMYAIMPERWQDDPAIQKAVERRGIKSTVIIAKSDFYIAPRQARAKVHIVRFAFNDFETDAERYNNASGSDNRNSRYRYKPTLGRDATDSFQIFIEDELGLNQTYSETTNKFYEFAEKERVRKELETDGTESFEIVASRGVLWALLENYDRDISHVLNEYKKIAELDATLLSELGVEYKALIEGLKEKLLGFRNVYWSLLFDELTVLSCRLTTKNKKQLLNTLSANALDFTYTNAVYIISFAVEMANELIETSLVEVFKELTCEKSISRHYKSNEHYYRDSWRHSTTSPNDNAKYVLDYRFVSSHWTNFGTNSWDSGLTEDARRYCDDLLVALKLLGYDNFTYSSGYKSLSAGDKLIVKGTDPYGNLIDLLHVRFYKNGNRHIQFNQEAMLRFNCTVSRILGWVRSKAEFEFETDSVKPVEDDIWHIGDGLKIKPSTMLVLTHRQAA